MGNYYRIAYDLIIRFGKFIPYLIILFLLVYIRECNPEKDCPQADTVTTITYHTDTILIKGKTVYKPQPYEVIDTFTVSPYVDTAKILSEYLILRKYNLPITDDTNSKISVYANVQYNRITDWTYTAEIYPHTTHTDHTTVYQIEPRGKLFVGAYLASDGQKLGIAPSVMFQTKKDHAYFGGYDLVNKYVSIGMFYKIKIKKP